MVFVHSTLRTKVRTSDGFGDERGVGTTGGVRKLGGVSTRELISPV